MDYFTVYNVKGASCFVIFIICVSRIDIVLSYVDNNEPQHVISNNVVCVTSTASDQPAHKRSLIRAFASRLNILWLLSY